MKIQLHLKIGLKSLIRIKKSKEYKNDWSDDNW